VTQIAHASSAYTSLSPATDQAIAWARGYVGQDVYGGYCLSFVHDAYTSAGVDIGSSYSAHTYAQEHQAQLTTEGTPPAGALVFWWGDSYNADGHVALSLGDGTAISTTERSYTGVHVMNIDERNQTKPYAGWMMVA
jgi:cell wall-associated NlpC family hydrolase